MNRTDKIAELARRTGCTHEQARKELVAEEWNLDDALLNIRQAQAQGAI